MAGLDEDLQDYRFGLSASWEIDVWRRMRNARDAAQLRYLATIEERGLMVTRLVAEIASLYYELLALDQQAEVVAHRDYSDGQISYPSSPLALGLSFSDSSVQIKQLQKEAGWDPAADTTKAQFNDKVNKFLIRYLKEVIAPAFTLAKAELEACEARLASPRASRSNLTRSLSSAARCPRKAFWSSARAESRFSESA